MAKRSWYCVDGSEIRLTHQLSLVVYPIIYRVFIHPRWWSPDFFHPTVWNLKVILETGMSSISFFFWNILVKRSGEKSRHDTGTTLFSRISYGSFLGASYVKSFRGRLIWCRLRLRLLKAKLRPQLPQSHDFFSGWTPVFKLLEPWVPVGIFQVNIFFMIFVWATLLYARFRYKLNSKWMPLKDMDPGDPFFGKQGWPILSVSSLCHL